MTRRVRSLVMTLVCVAVAVLIGTAAYAQGGGGTSSLNGVVVDASGAVLPGANVKVKDNATATEYTTVTAANGTFTVPALNPSGYTVTASLMGFKTAILNDVRINAAVPASVRVTLDVGGLEETVIVEGGSSIIQTQSPGVATTLDVNQISNLPLTSRSALDFIVGLAGVNTPAGSRDSTINGLPQSSINITIDGMSAQDNYLKTTDGFFARVSPRIDSVEEVTVSTAAQGAEATGHGAAQIRFVTRAGTNRFSGSGYHYLRHDGLNANTWFNNRDLPAGPGGKAPKTELRLYQPGTRAGGPIVIPGLFDGHDRAFFFVNYEEERQPRKVTRNRDILHPRSELGFFRYTAGGQVNEIDLLALAARNGHVATRDPIVAKLLADIRATTTQGGLVDLTNPHLQRFSYQAQAKSLNRYPTTRVDVNLTDKHRVYGVVYYNSILATPDLTNSREPRFPGFPGMGIQDSKRYTVSGTLRSNLSSSMVNEVRVGGTGGRTLFNNNLSPASYGGTPVGDQGGFLLDLNNALALANVVSTAAPSSREASTKVFDNTLNWIKGSHGISLGANWTQVDLWLKNQTLVPTVRFGVSSNDRADAMFSPANFPGSSTTQRNNARALYAVLTGRISEINSNARLNEGTDRYEFLGLGTQRGRMRELGFFIADSWRWKPTLTVSAGLRYELQLPFYPLNNSYSTATIADVWGVSGVGNLFKPGTTPGRPPQFTLYEKGHRAFAMDSNNVAPNLGFAWTPAARGGLLGRMLGAEGDSVFRAGYSLGYDRPGMSDYSGVFGANPGVSLTTNRDHTLGNLGTPGTILLRDRASLGPPSFPSARVYPMTDVVTGDIQIFDPHLQTPYAQSWSGGWQRKITGNIAVEARYVGTRHLQGWVTYNYNEINIVENGFLPEFRRAQANLAANIAAGRGDTFAFTGIAGTSPLPIFLAYFSGLPASQADDPSRYTSALFTNSTFVNPLARFNPQPQTAANALDADQARIDNALRAGLPANFLVANPHLLGGANLEGNGGWNRYDGLQLEARKRLSGGLQFLASYTFGHSYASSRYSLRTPRVNSLDTGTIGGVTHAFKANWVYELPFGRGRRFGGHTGGVLERLVGGWAFDGVARAQTGRLLDFGNVRLVNMTKKEFAKAYRLRFDNDNRVVYMLPQDIIDNTVKAFSVSATSRTGYGSDGPPSGSYLAPANGPDCVEIAPGYGDCGGRNLIVTGPPQIRFDLGAVKQVRITNRVKFEFRGEFINAFNHPWFTPVTYLNTATPSVAEPQTRDRYRVTGVQENSSRIIQLVTRLSW